MISLVGWCVVDWESGGQ